MHGPLRVAAALLLVLASSAAAAPLTLQTDSEEVAATAPAPVVQEPNTTSHLVLPDDEMRTVRFGTATLDVGGAVSTDNTRLHGRYSVTRLREAFEAAGDDRAEQRAVVNRTTERLSDRIDDLTDRERAALAAYNDGDIDTRAYLRELVAIQASAEALRKVISQLYTFDRAAGMPVDVTRIARMKAELAPLSGPVRGRLTTAMTGERTTPLRVYVETSETGFVISMVAEGQFSTHYIREAYYGGGIDNQWADKPINITEFSRRLGELYPWVAENNVGSSSILTNTPRYLRAGIYGIAFTHPHGISGSRDLVVYYDAGTDDVFYEVQRLNTDELPNDRLADATDDDLRVTVNGTYASGPLYVHVTDSVTGEPVGATVAVNGERVGTTDDGRLTTVAPREEFTVTASYRGRNVTATVDTFM
ncbi:carboxypeptidase-like regulatory domain-containing protein [Halorarius halobius]|uniref:carboxypeptidase-like regulatory domain-containing protein n=1 Tax=Halorarius halobius TaxID=2962671 RepID=UPI0020CB897C|nr:carboxypeptidase-like regulatory domain-containing protein [Halorarius halobius]